MPQWIDLTDYWNEECLPYYDTKWFERRKQHMAPTYGQDKDVPLLTKQVLKEEEDSTEFHGRPIRGCPCYVHITGWYLTEEEVRETLHEKSSLEDATLEKSRIFYSTRSKWGNLNLAGDDEPVRVPLLLQTPEQAYFESSTPSASPSTNPYMTQYTHEEADWHPPGFHAAVSTMGMGEKSLILCHPLVGYGLETDEYFGKVPQNSFLIYEVILTDWKESLPPVPSTVDTMRYRQQKRQEEELQARECEISWKSRIDTAHELKDEGNKSLSIGKLQQAKEAYDKAFSIIFIEQQSASVLTSREVTALRSLRTALHANRSLVNLKQKNVSAAIWDINKALDSQPSNTKYIFRKASVRKERIRQLLEKHMEEFFDAEALLEDIQKAKLEFCQSSGLLERDDENAVKTFIEDSTELVIPPSMRRDTPRPLDNPSADENKLPWSSAFVRRTTVVSLLKSVQESSALQTSTEKALRALAEYEQETIRLLKQYWKKQTELYRGSMRAFHKRHSRWVQNTSGEHETPSVDSLPELEEVER
eukprot:gb/GECG01003059.1/.p1 GENE.gb/GECG01003059.1/~~gb/GECG01003059.1/.p1  ORF type:complete len:532 (+),score=76.88 gb/GECG01003059.1/:1-1596(+)